MNQKTSKSAGEENAKPYFDEYVPTIAEGDAVTIKGSDLKGLPDGEYILNECSGDCFIYDEKTDSVTVETLSAAKRVLEANECKSTMYYDPDTDSIISLQTGKKIAEALEDD